MPKTGKNIYKRRDGRWEGRFIKEYVNGRARYGAVYARTYGEVCRKLEEARQEWKEVRRAPVRAGKLGSLAESWLAEAGFSLKESSIVRYQDILRCYILPEFGEKDLSEISNEEIKAFCNRLQLHGGAKGQGLSGTTVSETLTVMNCIRLHALGKDLPVAFTTKCVSVKKEKKGIRVFTPGEQEKLTTYLQENMDPICLGIYLCLYTGLRVGELCALKWSAISLEEKWMSISQTMQRLRVDGDPDRKTRVRIYTPKTGNSVRVIPLPERLTETLRPFYLEGAFLLTGEREHFLEPRIMQARFKKILEACGIEAANFHALRHTFATRCVERGFDVKSLSEILGHASVSITMDRYVHPSMALKSRNMERLFQNF